MSGSRGRKTGSPAEPALEVSVRESVVEGCASGDRRRALEAMRAVLAEAMDAASPQVVAQVAARLQAVVRELAELPAASGGSVSDDLARRRQVRRSEAAGQRSASGEGV